MCGIIGYTGPLEAKDLLLNGLSGLEYRGYDSAGIAYFNTASQVKVIKKVGKVAALRECVKKTGDIPTAESAIHDGQPMEVSQMKTPIPTAPGG